MKIAIDGPGGAGKSTLSKKLALHFGFVYIDTGAMYRTAGLACVREGIVIREQTEKAVEIVTKSDIDLKITDKGQRDRGKYRV